VAGARRSARDGGRAATALPPVKVISGGQTGADRAGLEAAAALGLLTGGQAPAGFLTEAGPDPSLEGFGLTAGGLPEARTERNVVDADATVIFARRELGPGSELTRIVALKHRKPVVVLDPWAPDAARALTEFLELHAPRVLNVAGDRESQAPGIYERVRGLLTAVLTTLEPGGRRRRREPGAS
jgi:putative molybdenum carrier protein